MKRWNIDAPANDQYEEHPEGQWVRFEDHEEALAEVELNLKRCQNEGADIWGELARRIGLELDAALETNQALLARLEAAKAAYSDLARRMEQAAHTLLGHDSSAAIFFGLENVDGSPRGQKP